MLEWIISSTVLTAVVIVLRLIFKGRMSLRLQYALWAIVLVRLLVPISFGSTGMSVQNIVDRPAAQAQVTVDTLARDTQGGAPGSLAIVDPLRNENAPPLPENEQKVLEGLLIEPQIADESSESIREQAQAAVTTQAQPLSVTEILTIVWLLGAGMIALWFFVTNLRFWFKLRKARQLQDVDGAPLPVYVTDRIDTPCLFGLIKPKIYVTPEVAGDSAALRYSIEHEATHRRHGDHVWSLLRGLCLALHWYNPLVWVAAVLSRNDAELACDEATIRRIGEDNRAEYGRTLIQLTCEKRPALFVAATTMTGSGRTIKERIRLIVKKPKTAVITLIAIVLVIAIAVGCTFTGAKPEEETGETKAELDVSDIPALLDAIDLQEATLIYHDGSAKTGKDTSYSAGAAIRAEHYLETIKQIPWQDCELSDSNTTEEAWDSIQLAAPRTTVTFYDYSEWDNECEIHVETDGAELWLKYPDAEKIYRIKTEEDRVEALYHFYYMIMCEWFSEAQYTALYGGNGRLLTAEKLENFCEFLRSSYQLPDGEIAVKECPAGAIRCFLTSTYSDVRDIRASEFLRFFPYREGDVLTHTGEAGDLYGVQRTPRSRVNEVLMTYAGITVDDMNTDWYTEADYDSVTDCFVCRIAHAALSNNNFLPAVGVENGSVVTLWGGDLYSLNSQLRFRLTLEKTDDGWQVRSFVANEGEMLTAPEQKSEELYAAAWQYAEESAQALGYDIAPERYTVCRWDKNADVIFTDRDGTRSLAVSFDETENGAFSLASADPVRQIDGSGQKDVVRVNEAILDGEGSERLLPVADYARDYVAQRIAYWNERTGNPILEAEITGLTKMNTGLVSLTYEIPMYLLEYRLLPENQTQITLADDMKTEKIDAKTWITEQSSGGQPYLLLARSTSDDWLRICTLDTAMIERISGMNVTPENSDACRTAGSQLFHAFDGKGTLCPAVALESLYESGDGVTLTLYLADGSAESGYPLDDPNFSGRLQEEMLYFNWTRLDALPDEPYAYWLTAVSEDGMKRITFRADSGAGTMAYSDGITTSVWRALPVSGEYEAESVAEHVRHIYDEIESNVDHVVPDVMPFSFDGTAEQVAGHFVTAAYIEYNDALAAGRRMDELEIVRWSVDQVSSDGYTVTGNFVFAFTPPASYVMAANDHEGTGKYEGKIISRQLFVLQLQSDGNWHCIRLERTDT